MTRTLSRLLFAAAFLAFAGKAMAQDAEATRKKMMLPVPTVFEQIGPGSIFRGAPGTNTSSPLAFGPNWGDAFIGGGYQAQTRGVRQSNGTISANGADDGSISAGFGLGNSKDAVGLEVVATSLSTFRSGFGNRTSFSFKVHRMLGNSAAIAVGVQSAFIVGGQKTDGQESYYAVASKVFTLPSSNSMGLFKAVTISGGLGNGSFRFLEDVANDHKTVNAFGSASILVQDQVSAIIDYSGQDLNLGVSVVPFKAFPLVITPALADVTQTASKTMRFTLGVGIGMHFN